VDLKDIIFQPNETCDAMLAGVDTINQMIEDSLFIGHDIFPYLDELFSFCDK
jgi:hypothetical protein